MGAPIGAYPALAPMAKTAPPFTAASWLPMARDMPGDHLALVNTADPAMTV